MRIERTGWISSLIKALGLPLAFIFGFALAAQAADGIIEIPGARFEGAFGHPSSFGTPPTLYVPYLYGEVIGGTTLVIHSQAKDGRHIRIVVVDPIGKLKAPRTYTVVDPQAPEPEDGVYATVDYHGSVVCRSKGGTLKLSTRGGVNDLITGVVVDLKWSTNAADCQKLGSKGFFKTQRANDRLVPAAGLVGERQ